MSYTPTNPLVTSKLPKLDLEILLEYRREHLASVRKRLQEFKTVRTKGSERIFYELCYCILTPQSSGVACDQIMVDLVNRGVLRNPMEKQGELEEALKKTRFWKKKTHYVIKAWERFMADDKDEICNMLAAWDREFEHTRDIRGWFRGHMRGFGIGMKEASHFLRNIGFYEDIAIVDRHVIRCLEELCVIENEGSSLKSDRDYLDLEVRMTRFSSTSGVPLEELDLLFWSAMTGYIFK